MSSLRPSTQGPVGIPLLASPQPGRNSFRPPNGLCSCDFPATASSLKPHEGHLVSESSQDSPSVPRAPSSPKPSPSCLSSQFILPFPFLGRSSWHRGTSSAACLAFYLDQAGREDAFVTELQGPWGRGPPKGLQAHLGGVGVPKHLKEAESTGSPLAGCCSWLWGHGSWDWSPGQMPGGNPARLLGG